MSDKHSQSQVDGDIAANAAQGAEAGAPAGLAQLVTKKQQTGKRRAGEWSPEQVAEQQREQASRRQVQAQRQEQLAIIAHQRATHVTSQRDQGTPSDDDGQDEQTVRSQAEQKALNKRLRADELNKKRAQQRETDRARRVHMHALLPEGQVRSSKQAAKEKLKTHAIADAASSRRRSARKQLSSTRLTS
jgi:hypothetical protein